MRRALWIVPLLVTALGAAAAHASSAAPARATSTTDVTYSCAVSSERHANLFASASKDPKHPAILSVTTGVKTKQENGATVTLSQLSVQAAKNGLIIDKSSCRHTKQIPLKPKGLLGPPTTVTASLRGYDGERCDSAARVVFRLRLTTTGGIPSHALLAIRNDNAKSKAIAFYNWSPKKITEYTGTSCSTAG
jgi:hypothetical protein